MLSSTLPERKNKTASALSKKRGEIRGLGARDTVDWTYHKHTSPESLAHQPGLLLPKTEKRDFKSHLRT